MALEKRVDDESDQGPSNRFSVRRIRGTDQHDVVVAYAPRKKIVLLIENVVSNRSGANGGQRIHDDEYLARPVPLDYSLFRSGCFVARLAGADDQRPHVNDRLGVGMKIIEGFENRLADRLAIRGRIHIGDAQVFLRELPQSRLRIELTYERRRFRAASARKRQKRFEVLRNRIILHVYRKERRRGHQQTQRRITESIRGFINTGAPMGVVEGPQFLPELWIERAQVLSQFGASRRERLTCALIIESRHVDRRHRDKSPDIAFDMDIDFGRRNKAARRSLGRRLLRSGLLLRFGLSRKGAQT